MTTEIREGTPTPWGPVQTYDGLGAGVYVVDGEGHGGLYVPAKILKTIPPAVRQTVLKEYGWPEGWAEEDCHLPIAMAFVYPHLDPNRVERTFPAQSRSGKDPIAFWQDLALKVAQEYDSLKDCVPYLETETAPKALPL